MKWTHGLKTHTWSLFLADFQSTTTEIWKAHQNINNHPQNSVPIHSFLIPPDPRPGVIEIPDSTVWVSRSSTILWRVQNFIAAPPHIQSNLWFPLPLFTVSPRMAASPQRQWEITGEISNIVKLPEQDKVAQLRWTARTTRMKNRIPQMAFRKIRNNFSSQRISQQFNYDRTKSAYY